MKENFRKKKEQKEKNEKKVKNYNSFYTVLPAPFSYIYLPGFNPLIAAWLFGRMLVIFMFISIRIPHPFPSSCINLGMGTSSIGI